MSTSVTSAAAGARSSPSPSSPSNTAIAITLPDHASRKSRLKPENYNGFIAGIFSGLAKLTVGHPFDTIKVRLQTTSRSHFSGPLDCLRKTVRNEGVRALYKGATPPALGWMAMDSLMLGSLTAYRRLLHAHLFTPAGGYDRLPALGHALAGTGAGWTVCLIAGPVEHIKARLQIQYAAAKQDRLYKGPVDCTRQILRAHGLRGLYHGLLSTLVFRSFFFFWWGSYDVFSRLLRTRTALSEPAVNFWAGGLSAQVFWLTAYPSDVVKQRIMTDPLGAPLRDGAPRFRTWRQAAVSVYRDGGVGWRGYWRGFVPCFLRAFPANAMALLCFEGVMRALPQD